MFKMKLAKINIKLFKMPIAIYEGLPIVPLSLNYRKTAEDDHYTESAAYQLDLVSVQADQQLIGEIIEVAIRNKTIQNGSIIT